MGGGGKGGGCWGADADAVLLVGGAGCSYCWYCASGGVFVLGKQLPLTTIQGGYCILSMM